MNISKIYFSWTDVIKLVTGTGFACAIYYGLKAEIRDVAFKVDNLSVQNIADQKIINYRIEAIDSQVKINTIAIIAIKEFIKPDEPIIKYGKNK